MDKKIIELETLINKNPRDFSRLTSDFIKLGLDEDIYTEYNIFNDGDKIHYELNIFKNENLLKTLRTAELV
jgi:hypothetical protein